MSVADISNLSLNESDEDQFSQDNVRENWTHTYVGHEVLNADGVIEGLLEVDEEEDTFDATMYFFKPNERDFIERSVVGVISINGTTWPVFKAKSIYYTALSNGVPIPVIPNSNTWEPNLGFKFLDPEIYNKFLGEITDDTDLYELLTNYYATNWEKLRQIPFKTKEEVMKMGFKDGVKEP